VAMTVGGIPVTTSPAACAIDNAGTFGPCSIVIPTALNGALPLVVSDTGGASRFTQTFTVTGGAGVVVTGVKPNIYSTAKKAFTCPAGASLTGSSFISTVNNVTLKGVGFNGVTSPDQV